MHKEKARPTPARKLLVRCLVCLDQETAPVEIKRGDVVVARDGVEAGVVAAVSLDCCRQKATHFLFEFVPPTAVYYLIPLSLIVEFDEKGVWLKITSEMINSLPMYQSDC